MNLLVDLGNSRLKWRLDGPGNRAGTVPFSGDWPALLARDWSTLARPDRVVGVSVQSRDIEAAYERCVKELWNIRPDRVPAAAGCCGVASGYTDPSQLGPDRLIAMVGARVLTAGPALVVDCGTAVTIDLVDRSGRHRGGWILPGINTMGSALRSRAAALAERPSFDAPALGAAAFGCDTNSGIAQGARAAVAGAVLQALRLGAERLGRSPDCLITGGDSTMVLPLLEGRCRHVPDLLFAGLARYAEETFLL